MLVSTPLAIGFQLFTCKYSIFENISSFQSCTLIDSLQAFQYQIMFAGIYLFLRWKISHHILRIVALGFFCILDISCICIYQKGRRYAGIVCISTVGDNAYQLESELWCRPEFTGMFIEQSLTHNRARKHSKKDQYGQVKNQSHNHKTHIVTTMYHEEEDEMKNLLRSLHLLDQQCPASKKHLEHFTAHIIFDDAFERGVNVDPTKKKLNQYAIRVLFSSNFLDVTIPYLATSINVQRVRSASMCHCRKVVWTTNDNQLSSRRNATQHPLQGYHKGETKEEVESNSLCPRHLGRYY